MNKFIGLKGNQIIYRKLIEHKVKDVFMFSGGAIMGLIDQFYKGSIKYYVNTHEQNCGHAATAYARSSGKTGVVITTSGPGFTNTLTPMLDAQNDSTPLVVISGQVSLSTMGTNAFQESPATELSKNVTKWSCLVENVSDLPDIIDTAFKIANDRKKGVVHIDLPKCVGNEIFKEKVKSKITFPKLETYFPEYNPEFLATIINNSEKPVLYVGQGCNDYSDILKKVAITGNIPVTTTIHAMGVFPEYNKLSLKFLGMHGNPAANYAIQNADTIIAVGSRFDDRTTGNIYKYAPKCKNIIHCNIEKSEINKIIKPVIPIVDDCGNFLKNIKPFIKYINRRSWIDIIDDWKIKFPIKFPRGEFRVEEVLLMLNKYMDHFNTIISTGVGNHQMHVCQMLKWVKPKSYIGSGSAGCMGCGLPFAIGIKIANPDKTVIDFDGDGSFMMTMGDLKTIKEYNLDIKIMIINNNCQSMVHVWEKLFYGGRHVATENKCNPSFTQVADAYGIKSLYCDNLEDLEDIIIQFLNYKGPILCEFKVISSECLPLVPPGKGLDEMITYDNIDDFFVDKNSLAPS